MKMLWTISLAALFAASAQAQSPSHLSNVAGYKAAFICSGVFNALRPVAEITADDLVRIYLDYREAMATLPDALIDRKAKTVSVTYAENFPPRIAAWRPNLGCAQIPSGAGPEAIAALPRLDGDAPKLAKNTPWPDGDRLTEKVLADTPQGFNLAAVAAAAFDGKTYGAGTDTTAILVVRDGVIVAEKYRKGWDYRTPQRTWSAAKSIAATIIGAAVEDGIIAVGEPAGLAQWSAPGDPRGAITVENLLNMGSGLDSSPAGNRTDDIYFGGGRVVDHAATRRLVSAPGLRFVYANNDTMLAMRVLRERMNDDAAYLRYAIETVLHPIGMRTTFLETDWNGDFILSSQVWTTARDLARLGLLYLNDGAWNGARILPEGWPAYVATPAPAQPARGPGYGAQFWLFGAAEGLPEGTYAAQGNRGQYLMIIPERNILVVRRGFDDGGGFDIARFTADVLAALEE